MTIATTFFNAPSSDTRCVRQVWQATVALLMLFATPAMAVDLTGVVVDAAGEPVARVPVALVSTDVRSTAVLELAKTRCDKDGSFRVTVPNEWLDTPSFWRQELSLVSRSMELGTGGIVVSRELPLPRQRLTIRLKPWTHRQIALKTADGEPLAGVRIALTNLLLPAIYPRHLSQASVRHVGVVPSDWQSEGTTNQEGVAELLLPSIESVGGFEAEVEKNDRPTVAAKNTP